MTVGPINTCNVIFSRNISESQNTTVEKSVTEIIAGNGNWPSAERSESVSIIIVMLKFGRLELLGSKRNNKKPYLPSVDLRIVSSDNHILSVDAIGVHTAGVRDIGCNGDSSFVG